MKQIKQKLILLFSASSLLTTSLVSITANNKYFEVNDHKVGGFHITVKSSNRNLVNSIKSWNNDSQYLYDTVNPNTIPLNINFDQYDQIISNDWIQTTNKSENIINDKGYNQLKKFIGNNKSNFKNAAGFLANSVFGHTFNEKSNNLILQYHQSIKESIDEGLFATIYEASNVDTLMTVPYNLQPTTSFQNAEFTTRAKIFPIGPFDNTKDSFSNEMFVFYVHRPFAKSGLKISSNQENDARKNLVKTNSDKTFDYAILNQDYSNNNIPTTYNITWNANDNTTILKNETVTINSSTPNIKIANQAEKNNKSSLIHQYFINNEKNSNLQITAFSQIKSEAIITPNISKDQWTYQWVDDNLSPFLPPKLINEQPLIPYQFYDHTIYLLRRLINNKIDDTSSQYLNVYRINPLIPNFSGLTSFANSKLGIDFKQYLQETTNINCEINSLDFGQLRYWLLFYEHDLINHLYVNIKNNGLQYNLKNSNNPFLLPEVKLTITTLLNNWNIIIIGSTILLIIITVPIMITILRKRRIKK